MTTEQLAVEHDDEQKQGYYTDVILTTSVESGVAAMETDHDRNNNDDDCIVHNNTKVKIEGSTHLSVQRQESNDLSKIVSTVTRTTRTTTTTNTTVLRLVNVLWKLTFRVVVLGVFVLVVVVVVLGLANVGSTALATTTIKSGFGASVLPPYATSRRHRRRQNNINNNKTNALSREQAHETRTTTTRNENVGPRLLGYGGFIQDMNDLAVLFDISQKKLVVIFFTSERSVQEVVIELVERKRRTRSIPCLPSSCVGCNCCC